MGEKMSEELELPAGFEPLQEDREERFAQEYLKNPSIAAAGKVAGYADRSTSWRVFYRKHVQDRIKFLQDERSVKLGVDAYYVLSKLKENLEGSLYDSEPNRAAANQAINMFGKHLGMFGDKVKHEITGADGGEVKVATNATLTINVVKPNGDETKRD